MAYLQKLLLALGCASLVAGVAGPAAANTYQLTFGASDFDVIGDIAPVPVSFVLGQVTFALNPLHDSNGSVTTDFINLPHGAVGYNYFSGTGTLLIGGTLNGVSSESGGTDDFSLDVAHFNTAPAYLAFSYTSAADLFSSFIADNGSVHVDVTSVATTPIPGALPLFISAIGGLGLVGWGRRKAAA